MKTIKLTQGQIALVDDEDFDFLIQFRWHAVKNKNRCTTYASTSIMGKTRYMHRFILGLKNRNVQADHIDHNGLHNYKSNLRVSTNSENNCNKGNERNNSSKYKGVHFEKQTNKWRAGISKDGVQKKLGRFDKEIEAANAYNKAAIFLHGEFAFLNSLN